MRDDDQQSELAARAATQRGETGDKIPGFDPAAAPMETDAEAGGSHVAGGAGAPAARRYRPPETSSGSAMRPMQGDGERAEGRTWLGLAMAALVVVVLMAAAVALMS